MFGKIFPDSLQDFARIVHLSPLKARHRLTDKRFRELEMIEIRVLEWQLAADWTVRQRSD